jgi:hypothetical protein
MTLHSVRLDSFCRGEELSRLIISHIEICLSKFVFQAMKQCNSYDFYNISPTVVHLRSPSVPVAAQLLSGLDQLDMASDSHRDLGLRNTVFFTDGPQENSSTSNKSESLRKVTTHQDAQLEKEANI